MTLPLTGTGPSAGGSYAGKVLSYSPIAYWPQWEPSSAVAQCLVNSAQNGTYVGVTLGQPGIGDGRTSPFYDGVLDYADVYSVPLRDAFSAVLGSVHGWFRVFNAGVWADAAARYVFLLAADGNNRILLQRTGVNNDLGAYYIAGGAISSTFTVACGGRTDWLPFAMTWNTVANRVRFYIDGAQVGADVGGLGVWVGNLANGWCELGSYNSAPNQPWHGYLAHMAVWDRELTLGEVEDLAVV